MPPSLSGHPLILAEICGYLGQHELSLMLRIDKQTYRIAGRILYRHLTVTRNRYGRSPLPSFQHVANWATSTKKRHPWRFNQLLEYVEILDIGEETLVSSSQAYTSLQQHGVPNAAFAPMTRLHTLVVRPGIVFYPGLGGVVGQGLQPKLLVVVGDFDALSRITGYQWRQIDGPSLSLQACAAADKLWSSVLHLHHIIPFEYPKPYPTDFIHQQPDCDVTASLPNILRYDLFYDVDKAHRDGDHEAEASRVDSHFLRSVAWAIRNTRHTLPMTIWLSVASQPAFIRRKGHVKEMVRGPFTQAAQYSPVWMERHFIDWDDRLLSQRLALIEAKLCGAEREKSWCGVSDGTLAYDPSLLAELVPAVSDQRQKGDEFGEDRGIQVELEWETVEAEDDGEEDNFSDEEEEDEEASDESIEEDSEGDDYYGRRRLWGGRYSGYRRRWYNRNERSMYDSDDEDDEDEDEVLGEDEEDEEGSGGEA